MRALKNIVKKCVFPIWDILVVSYFKITSPPNLLVFSTRLNKKILMSFGAKIGDNVRIMSPITLASVKINNGYHNLSVGNRCLIGGNTFFDLAARIVMKDGVSIGPGVIIMTHNSYNFNPFLEEKLAHSCGTKDVVIKEGTGIKAGALIVHGVTIGKNVVVAGNAVVNRDVPDNCFVGGVPAKVIQEIQ